MRIAFALLLAGCITTGDPRRVDATWHVASLANGSASCPATWHTARLVIDGASAGEWACTAGFGESSHVVDGSHTVRVDMLASDGSISASSLPASVQIAGFAEQLDTTLYIDAGYASVSWTFPPNAGPCDDGDLFDWIYLNVDGPTKFTQGFSCHDTQGTSAPMLAGAYHGSLSWGVEGKADWDFTIGASNQVTELPHVDL